MPRNESVPLRELSRIIQENTPPGSSNVNETQEGEMEEQEAREDQEQIGVEEVVTQESVEVNRKKKKKKRTKIKWRITPCVFIWPTWQPLPEKENVKQPESGNPLGIVTYRLMNDRFGLQYRMPKLLEILQETSADIICLQDVSPEFAIALAQESWVRSSYYLSDPFGDTFNSSEFQKSETLGHVILSKFPFALVLIEFVELNFNKAICTVFFFEGRWVGVASVTLDSDRIIRAKQLNEIFHELRNCDDIIICGDFATNHSIQVLMCDHPQPDKFVDTWVDSHSQSRKTAPGFTIDPANNSMLMDLIANDKERKIDSSALRADRIIYFSKNDFWDATLSSELLGNKPMPFFKNMYPSTHFGLYSVIKSSQVPVASSCSLM